MKNDFTQLAFGTLVSGGRTIIHCPRCRRLGALERYPNGARRCVHVEESVMLDQGPLIEPLDLCDLARPRSIPQSEIVLLDLEASGSPGRSGMARTGEFVAERTGLAPAQPALPTAGGLPSAVGSNPWKLMS